MRLAGLGLRTGTYWRGHLPASLHGAEVAAHRAVEADQRGRSVWSPHCWITVLSWVLAPRSRVTTRPGPLRRVRRKVSTAPRSFTGPTRRDGRARRGPAACPAGGRWPARRSARPAPRPARKALRAAARAAREPDRPAAPQSG